MIKGMEDMKSQKGYIPTVKLFEPIDNDYVGFFSPNGGRNTDMTTAEISTVNSFLDMAELSNKTYLYSEEKINNFKKNNLC